MGEKVFRIDRERHDPIPTIILNSNEAEIVVEHENIEYTVEIERKKRSIVVKLYAPGDPVFLDSIVYFDDDLEV